MNDKLESPVVIGQKPGLDPENIMSAQESMELYVAIYTDWQDADMLLERLGCPLEQDGILIPLSDRIEQAVKNAKEG